MKIHCPDCDAVYTISEHQITGRAAKVVCRKCGARFVIQGALGDSPAPSESAHDEPQGGPVVEPAPPERQGAGPSIAASPEGPAVKGGGKEGLAEASPASGPKPGAAEAPLRKGPKEGPRSKLAEYSVFSMAPKYPKYRDPLIIIAVVLILVGLLAGVHFAVKGTTSSLDRLFRDPMQFFADMVFGSDKVALCTSFLDRHGNRLAVLGQDLKYYPIKEETRVLDGRETATLVIRVQGTGATKDVFFRLEERQGQWEILEVALDLGGGREQRLFP